MTHENSQFWEGEDSQRLELQVGSPTGGLEVTVGSSDGGFEENRDIQGFSGMI